MIKRSISEPTPTTKITGAHASYFSNNNEYKNYYLNDNFFGLSHELTKTDNARLADYINNTKFFNNILDNIDDHNINSNFPDYILSLIDIRNPKNLDFISFGNIITYCYVKYKNGMYSSQTKINKKEDIPIVDKGDTLYIYMGTRTLYKYTATNEIMSIIINREINDMNICQIAQSIIDRVKLNYENYASQNEDIMKYDDMKYDDNISIGLLKIKF